MWENPREAAVPPVRSLRTQSHALPPATKQTSATEAPSINSEPLATLTGFDKRTNEQTNEQTNKRLKEQTNEQTIERTTERANERTNEQRNERTNERTIKRTNE